MSQHFGADRIHPQTQICERYGNQLEIFPGFSTYLDLRKQTHTHEKAFPGKQSVLRDTSPSDGCGKRGNDLFGKV